MRGPIKHIQLSHILGVICELTNDTDHLNVQKFYTNKILGKQNLHQKMCKLCQTFNHKKITYLIK